MSVLEYVTAVIGTVFDGIARHTPDPGPLTFKG